MKQNSRFLYLFFIDRNCLTQAVDALTQNLDWEIIEKPYGLYYDEMLYRVRQFLFSNKADNSCYYLKFKKQTINKWFNKPLHDQKQRFIAKLNQQAGIELFLSHYGVGILSITLTNENSTDFDQIKQFNYLLSQARGKLTPRLLVPYPSENSKLPPAPAEDAALSERLGKYGCVFDLVELRKYLLQPLNSFGFRQIQRQFSVYSVIHFDNEVNLTEFKPLLSALSHVEEQQHPGSREVNHQIMNNCHLAGVGSLGAAHLTIEQYPAQQFDRALQVLNKYFIAYLTALMQRLIVQRLIDNAADIVHKQGTTTKSRQQLQNLHNNILDFKVTGYFTEISHREAINQYYQLCQIGLRIPTSLATVQDTLHHIDINNDAAFQQGISKKVEWLQILFIVFSAVEVSSTIAENFNFSSEYTAISTILLPIIAGILSYKGLTSENSKWKLASIYGGILGFFGWLSLGFWLK
jgi:hypothetical protein